jgi:hypothetical protein
MLAVAVTLLTYASAVWATTTVNLADLGAERQDPGHPQIKRQAAQTLTPLPWNFMKSPFVRILSSVYGPCEYATESHPTKSERMVWSIEDKLELEWPRITFKQLR